MSVTAAASCRLLCPFEEMYKRYVRGLLSARRLNVMQRATLKTISRGYSEDLQCQGPVGFRACGVPVGGRSSEQTVLERTFRLFKPDRQTDFCGACLFISFDDITSFPAESSCSLTSLQAAS